MNVLFLEIETDARWGLSSIGPAYLAAYLRRHGHAASMLQVPLDQEINPLIASIEDNRPDIIGLSLTSRQWLRAKQVVADIKKVLPIPIIAGGLHATFESDLVLNSPGFDYVCIGEGEQALLEFVQSLQNGRTLGRNIKNIRAKGEPMPPLRDPVSPIDDLPFMARDLVQEKTGIAHLQTQRGCPFRCTYCAGRSFSDLYQGAYASYGRRRSVGNVLSELHRLREQAPLNYVVFLDDTFTIKHSWVAEFCDRYKAELHIPFSINGRAETVNQKLLGRIAGAGCMHVIYGVESGSERVRKEILNRNITNERLVQVFEWTKQAGMLATANYMLGIPGETVGDLAQTVALHEQLQPDDFGYFVFYPYPGTELYRVCKEKGYLPDNYFDLPANNRSSILNLPDLTQQDIETYYDKFTQLRIRQHMKYVPAGGDPSYRRQVVNQLREAAAHG